MNSQRLQHVRSPFALSDLEQHLKNRVAGQESAVNQVLPWIKSAILGFLRPDKPAATFLFVGQTGVGKTQLAKEIAYVVTGDRQLLITFDMGQYSDPREMSCFLAPRRVM